MHTRCVLLYIFTCMYTARTAVNCVPFSYRFKWTRNVDSCPLYPTYISRIPGSLLLLFAFTSSSLLYIPRCLRSMGENGGGRSSTKYRAKPPVSNSHLLSARLGSTRLGSAGTFKMNRTCAPRKRKAGLVLQVKSLLSLAHANSRPPPVLVPVRIPFWAFIDALPFMQETRSVCVPLPLLCVHVCVNGSNPHRQPKKIPVLVIQFISKKIRNNNWKIF